MSSESITTRTISVKINSSRVDLNASIKYAGSLLINPTVSVINEISLPSFNLRVVVVSVVNNSALFSFCSPVKLLNKVVFPAEVYPASEIVLNPSLSLPCL